VILHSASIPFQFLPGLWCWGHRVLSPSRIVIAAITDAALTPTLHSRGERYWELDVPGLPRPQGAWQEVTLRYSASTCQCQSRAVANDYTEFTINR